MQLRVMTFNLLNAVARGPGSDWALRRGPAASIIDRWAPDIVGVQEATARQLEDLAAALPGYAVVPGPISGRSKLPVWAAVALPAAGAGLVAMHRGSGTRRGASRAASVALLAAGLAPSVAVAASLWADGKLDEGEHCALLCRRGRLTLEASSAFWLSPQPDRPCSVLPGCWTPRVAHAAKLRMVDGSGSLTVYNTHVDVMPWTWRSSGLILRQQMDAGWNGAPQLLMGDFNAPASSRLYSSLLADGTAPALADAWVAGGTRVGPASTFHKAMGQARWPGRIDRIFARPAARVARAETVTWREDGVWPSDHFPVVADLEWSDA